MAFYLNKYDVVGNLVADPELKNIGKDKKVCKFRIAVNNPHNEEALFFYVDVWGREGEKCGMLKKGALVFITNASVIPKQYEKTTPSGDVVKMSTFTINVDGYCGKVQFGPKSESESESESEPSSKPKYKKPNPPANKKESKKEPVEDPEPSEDSSNADSPGEISSFEEEFEF
jgi:single-stranded DNA-binding protein